MKIELLPNRMKAFEDVIAVERTVYRPGLVRLLREKERKSLGWGEFLFSDGSTLYFTIEKIIRFMNEN